MNGMKSLPLFALSQSPGVFHEIALVGAGQQRCARFEQHRGFGADGNRLAQINVPGGNFTVPPPALPQTSKAF